MTRLKYCHIQGKVRYPTYYAAARVQKAMSTKHHHNGGSCYFCQHCHSWHITHFTDVYEFPLYYGQKRLNKKQKRSERQRIPNLRRRYQTRIETDNLQSIINHKITTMVNLKVTTGTPREQVFEDLSLAAADIKNNMGIVANVAYYCMLDAIDQAKKHPNYRQTTKQTVNNHHKVWDGWFTRMQSSTDHKTQMLLFDLSCFDTESKAVFREGITNREYFELWQGTGGEAYVKARSFINAMRLKFQRINENHHLEHADILAWMDVAGIMIELARNTFNDRIAYFERERLKNVLYPSPRQLFASLDPTVLSNTWFKLRDLFPALPDLTDEEKTNLAMTADDIRRKLLSFEEATDSIMQAVDSYDDVMLSKGTIRKMKMHAAEDVEKFRQ